MAAWSRSMALRRLRLAKRGGLAALADFAKATVAADVLGSRLRGLLMRSSRACPRYVHLYKAGPDRSRALLVVMV